MQDKQADARIWATLFPGGRSERAEAIQAGGARTRAAVLFESFPDLKRSGVVLESVATVGSEFRSQVLAARCSVVSSR